MKADPKIAMLMQLGDAVLRHWWTVVAGLCLGAGSAMITLNYLPKTYEASTKIFAGSRSACWLPLWASVSLSGHSSVVISLKNGRGAGRSSSTFP